MKRTVLPLAVCAALAATPGLAGTATLGGVDLFIDGNIGFGYGTLVNNSSTAGSVSLGVPITLGSTKLVLGVRVDGYTNGPTGIYAAGPFAGLMTNFGDFWVGDVEHATAANLPRFHLGATPFIDTVVVPYPFGKSYSQFIDTVTPVVFNTFRYDGQFGDFKVSASYDENDLGALFASYDFGQVTVFGAGEFRGSSTAWYLGAEASFNQIDLVGMLQTGLGGTQVYYTAQGTYNFNDQWSATAALSSSGTGTTFWGVSGAYRVNDLVSASVGYNDVAGTGYYGAMVTIDLN